MLAVVWPHYLRRDRDGRVISAPYCIHQLEICGPHNRYVENFSEFKRDLAISRRDNLAGLDGAIDQIHMSNRLVINKSKRWCVCLGRAAQNLGNERYNETRFLGA